MFLFNRPSVALGLSTLAIEMVFRCRVRFSELDLNIGHVENYGGVTCQVIVVKGFVCLGAKKLGGRDKAESFRTEVLLVNRSGSWCASHVDLWLNLGGNTFPQRVCCEYQNCPCSSELLYPSHLCFPNPNNTSAAGSRPRVMDTDTCRSSWIDADTFISYPHTPLMLCKEGCGQTRPVYSFTRVESEQQRKWLCSCREHGDKVAG